MPVFKYQFPCMRCSVTLKTSTIVSNHLSRYAMNLTTPIVGVFDVCVGQSNRRDDVVRGKRSARSCKYETGFVQDAHHVLAFDAFWCLVSDMKHTAKKNMAEDSKDESSRDCL